MAKISTIKSVGKAVLGRFLSIEIELGTSAKRHAISVKMSDSTKWPIELEDNDTPLNEVCILSLDDENILKQLPNATKGTLDICLTTYNSNGEIIGKDNKQVPVTVDSSIKPTIGVMAFTQYGQKGVVINKKGCGLNVSVGGCSAGTGSKIVSYTFSGPGIDKTIKTSADNAQVSISKIPQSGDITYSVKVTDTRGRSAYMTNTVYCNPYSNPKITAFSAYRCNEDGTKNASGTYIGCTYNVKISSIQDFNDQNTELNGLAINKMCYKKKGGAYENSTDIVEEKTTENRYITYSCSCVINQLDASVHDVYVTVKDKYGGVATTYATKVLASFRALNITKDGKGVAIGKLSTKSELFDCSWPISTDSPAQTMKNLTYRGQNVITQDNTSNWINQGNLATLYFQNVSESDFPATDGFILNVSSGPNGNQVHNIWMTQRENRGNGSMYHRYGNTDGWGASSWREILDSKNYTNYTHAPVVLYNNDKGSNGEVTLSQSVENFQYIEIFYVDNNGNGMKSTRLFQPNGKTTVLDLYQISNDINVTYLARTYYTISGNKISLAISNDSNRVGRIKFEGKSISETDTVTNYIYITQVVGYKV